MGSIYESKTINFTHITPATASTDPHWDDVTLLLDGSETDKSDATIGISGHTLTTGSGGKWGEGYSFDGSGGGLITMAGSTSPNLGSSFTIEAWIKLSSVPTWATVAGVWAYDTGRRSWALSTYGGKLWFATSDDGNNNSGSQLTGATTLSTGQWYFVQAVLDGGTGTVYLNGVSDGTMAMETPIHQTTDSWYVGAVGSTGQGDRFPGIIDDIRVTKAARTDYTIPTEFSTGTSQTVTVGQTTATAVSYTHLRAHETLR